MNVHINVDFNRNLFYGIVQKTNLDVCVITETHFDQNTGENIIRKSFGDKFT